MYLGGNRFTISDFNNFEFIITEILVGDISMNNKLMLSHI